MTRHQPSALSARSGGGVTTTGAELLERAAEVVARRRQQYGPPAEHFAQVARRWSPTLGTEVRREVVVLCQLDLDELVSGASTENPAEVAEVAEADGCAGFAAAEALLKSAEEERRSR